MGYPNSFMSQYRAPARPFNHSYPIQAQHSIFTSKPAPYICLDTTNSAKPNEYIEVIATMRDNEKPENTEKS